MKSGFYKQPGSGQCGTITTITDVFTMAKIANGKQAPIAPGHSGVQEILLSEKRKLQVTLDVPQGAIPFVSKKGGHRQRRPPAEANLVIAKPLPADLWGNSAPLWPERCDCTPHLRIAGGWKAEAALEGGCFTSQTPGKDAKKWWCSERSLFGCFGYLIRRERRFKSCYRHVASSPGLATAQAIEKPLGPKS
ncbi:hypothetical protein P7K49_021682 [Saguinus oedipus]|uniref:Uncharacterized protein n=1 Tax=Saguinus oedipus TaxID=9490 RepID=A0ABQ9UTC1_SAGOE|nr:hypothetical protein P7K49_021682 [Saguinus oedipus]